jgi:molybdopterin molybdotransferase
VVADLLQSPVDLPDFRRSSVDGYAVRAADTYGATASFPAYLTCIGTIAMGTPADLSLSSGHAALIHTGGMLPDSADAVVMVEKTQPFGDSEIEILAPVAPGENVVQVGDDMAHGHILLTSGQRVRPQDIGGLLAVGITELPVVVRPRIGLLSSGDELVTPDSVPQPGQIRDINAYTLAALISEAGGDAVHLGIARDTWDDLYVTAERGLRMCDMLVITAGSSVSTRDLTRDVISALGAPGVLHHGLAVKPGKPTVLAVCGGKPVIGLPGNPASALLVARQIVLRIIQRWFGQSEPLVGTLQAVLTANLPSAVGREDLVPVRLVRQADGWLAEPIFGKSTLIFTLVAADGLAHIPLDSAGLKAGTPVDVIPLR